MKKFVKYLLIIAILLSVAAYAIPWKSVIEAKLKDELQNRDWKSLEFKISEIGLHEITFSDIAFNELKLPSLSVNYSPFKLIKGDFHGLKASEVKFHKNDMEFILGGVDVSLLTNKWKVDNINISGAPLVLPPLSAQGDIKYSNDKLELSGVAISEDKKTSAKFELNYPLAESDKANLKVHSIGMPWNEGTLASKNINIPLNSTAPVNITVTLKQVSLNSLLASATSGKATATGVVSGTIPVTINRDGSFIIKKGDLKADKAGTINLSPDVIPSDAPQVALVRDLLKEFHYNVFSMGIESADNKQLVMLLSLQGNNPDVYNGRAIKLNVHLTGDVIDLITQSLNLLHPK